MFGPFLTCYREGTNYKMILKRLVHVWQEHTHWSKCVPQFNKSLLFESLRKSRQKPNGRESAVDLVCVTCVCTSGMPSLVVMSLYVLGDFLHSLCLFPYVSKYPASWLKKSKYWGDRIQFRFILMTTKRFKRSLFFGSSLFWVTDTIVDAKQLNHARI